MPPAPCRIGSTMMRGDLARVPLGQLRSSRRPRPAAPDRRPVGRGRPAAAARTPAPSAAPVNSECIPFTGSHTLIGANVSPWYPPRTVSIRVRPCWPGATWYCSASLIATSTETEPESQKNTCRSGSGVISTSRSASWIGRLVGQPAEHHVAEVVHLALHRRVQHRVPVAVDHAPPRRHRVDRLDHAAGAVVQLQPYAGRTADQPDRRRARSARSTDARAAPNPAVAAD